MNKVFLLISAFALSLLLTPLVRLFAIRNGLIAYPRSDRWHTRPTALLGGVAIFISFVIPSLFLHPKDKTFLALVLGGTFLFLVGLADDKFHFAPYAKLFAQFVAGSIAVFLSVVLGFPANSIFAVPLTLLCIVGVTNSFNLLDNIDGLAAGIAAISSLMLFLSSLIVSSNPLGNYALILAGAALGFLPYNFNPARIFMGDSGSMFLGYSLAVISIAGTARHISNLFIVMLIPVLILSVPIFDTVFVMVLRIIQGRKIFEGGKDHTSHKLVTLGLSQRKTVFLLYSLSITMGLIAMISSRMNIFIVLVIMALCAIIFMFFGFFISEAGMTKNDTKLGSTKQGKENGETMLNKIFYHKRRIVEVLLDFVIICISYYSAYFLRFEGSIFAYNLFLIKESILWIILIKMSVFFLFGLYRGVWKYISISDLLTIFKVVTIGSVASILFLTFVFRFNEYSRAVFFIDWILLLLLISGVRILFRVIGEFFSRANETGYRILIYGAGDTGEMVAREIKRNRGLNYRPVGFIDDNPAKLKSKIQGITVLGSKEDIKRLVSAYSIREILIAFPSIEPDDFNEIAGICRECNIKYRKIKGILDGEEA